MKKHLISTVALAIFVAVFQAPTSSAADTLVNGNFSDSGGGWIGASFTGSGNAACPSGVPNIGTWEANALSFSYSQTTVYQDVVISKPSTMFLQFDVINRADQSLTRYFSAEFGTTSTGNFRPGLTTETKVLTFTTTSPNQTVRIQFTGLDELTWAGCYATRVKNVSLSFYQPTVIEPEKIYLPNDLLAAVAPALTKIGEFVSCSLGSYGYRSSRNSKGRITPQELDSATILLKTNNEIIGSASTDNYTNSPRSILGIKDSILESKIVGGVANWKLTNDSPSTTISCQILAYKEHQMTYTTVK